MKQLKEKKNGMIEKSDYKQAASATVPIQIEKLEAPIAGTLKGDLEGMEIGAAAVTPGDLDERGGLKTLLPKESPYHPILRSLKESDFKEFASKEYGILDPYKMKRRERTVVGVTRICQELESAGMFISRAASGALMVYKEGYWQPVDEKEFKDFLVEAMVGLGFKAEEEGHHSNKDDLYKQLKNTCPELKRLAREEILINLANGTLEFSGGSAKFRESRKEDYLTYKLPFDYNPDSTCPMFQAFLNEVLPEPESQAVLGEFFGSALIDNKQLKLEKALLLYGRGSNGKSVACDIMKSLFGEENFSTYSLESITNTNGYSRAKLEGKLLNYASEISGIVNTDNFKQLVSGESIEARLPYKDPYLMEKIPKLAFNINEFPRNSEKTAAFYRRLIIVPFSVQILPERQDKTLAQRIIKSELPGVFNWVLDGMKRLIEQQGFTHSPAAAELLEDFKLESDIVASFIAEKEFSPSNDGNTIMLADLYDQFSAYCKDGGFKRPSSQILSKRLVQLGFSKDRNKKGVFFYAKRKVAESEISKKYPYPG